MSFRLMAMALACFFLIFPLQPALAEMTSPNEEPLAKDVDLPTALDSEDFFDDLPFQQQRQILREEIQQEAQGLSPRFPSRQYNLLIR